MTTRASGWMRTLLVLAVALAATACGPHPGSRLLQFKVTDARGTVLESHFGTPDSLTTAEAWAHLGRTPFGIDEETLRVDVDPDDPLRGRLDGSLSFELRHVELVLASGTIDGLQLARASADDDRWHLTEAEVERTARAAGLTDDE